jgi:NADH dehydrogenase/NADH:ubiquinone oxidoreductase subunit G
MSDIDHAQAVVVVGEDLPVTQPIVGLHVHKAASKGAAVIRVDAGRRSPDLASRLDPSKPALILVGPSLIGGKDGPARLAALAAAAASVGGRIVALDREANVRGGLAIAAAFPARPASTGARALYLAGPHPKLEPGEAEFVIVQASYGDETLASADIVFPEATSFEAEGTLVNVEGRIQVSRPAVVPPGESRPGWRILQDLAGRLAAKGFECGSAAEVRAALAAAVPAFRAASTADPGDGQAFLAEGPARPPAIAGADTGRGRRRAPAAAPRDPDDYKGLNLAIENKSLKLIRGRRCPRS